ncbi:unnamed protein product [Ilex paraguariensis]|uniref:Uncharacterized protein n=1 Tax=Ilex paraguariensis TaxID=185542 RepID=A0ABC8SUV1_9AQUA
MAVEAGVGQTRDRFLPDSSESTLDLTKERGRRFSTSDIMDPRIRTDKKIRRPLSQSYISSQDQVVPQLQNKKDDKKGRDRRGVPVTQTTPSN